MQAQAVPDTTYTLKAEAFVFWTGSSLTLSVQNAEGWIYTVEAKSDQAIEVLCNLFPSAKHAWEAAHRNHADRNASDDPETIQPDEGSYSGSAEDSQSISDDLMNQLLELKNQGIPDLVFPRTT